MFHDLYSTIVAVVNVSFSYIVYIEHVRLNNFSYLCIFS